MRRTVAIYLTNTLLIALIVCIASVAIYVKYFYRPQVDPAFVEAITRSAMARIENNSPTIQREVLALGHETLPIVQTAFIEQVREDYPRFAQALEHEGSQYFNNLERNFLRKVKARYREYLQRHRRILAAEFPQHATRENVERILSAFEATFDELVERYYLDQFRHEAARTEKLWRAIPPARRPEADEPALEEQLAETTRQWMMTALQGSQ